MRRGLLPLGILAVIFNPLAPIRFDEDEWRVVDWIAATVFVLYAADLRWVGSFICRHKFQVVGSVCAILAIGSFASYVSRMTPTWTRQRMERETLTREAKESERQQREKEFESSAAGKVLRRFEMEREVHPVDAVLGSYGYRRPDGSVVDPGEGTLDTADPKSKEWYPGKDQP